jgi:hypothetical protein
MNVKFTAQVFFRNAAMLASKLVTLAGKLSLRGPRWAIVRLISSLPVKVIGAGYIVCIFTLTICLAFLAAKAAATDSGWLDVKFTFALGANEIFTGAWACCFFSTIGRMIFAAHILRLPLTKAFLRAKAALAVAIHHYFNSALFADDLFCNCRSNIFTKISKRFTSSTAKRTVFSRAAQAVCKQCFTDRADGSDSFRGNIACSGTINTLVLIARINAKFITASWARL